MAAKTKKQLEAELEALRAKLNGKDTPVKEYVSPTVVTIGNRKAELQLDTVPMGAGPEAGKYSVTPKIRVAAITKGAPSKKGGIRIPCDVLSFVLDNEDTMRSMIETQRKLTAKIGGKADGSVKEFAEA